MYKKNLVGLDGSKHGLDAAKSAIELAKAFGAELHSSRSPGLTRCPPSCGNTCRRKI